MESHRLLLVTANRWLDTCRLALAAREAGFTVDLLAPQGHPIAALEWVNHVDTYSVLRPHRVVTRVLNSADFDLVVPVDDPSAATLFDTYLAGRLKTGAARVVRRSLGNPATFGIRHARATVAEIAGGAGVSIARTWSVGCEDALPDLLTNIGSRAVLKVDGGSGGQEVVVVDDIDDARDAFRTLASPPRIKTSVGWLWSVRDIGHLRRTILRIRPTVSIQEFVAGEPATLSAIAWEGELLGYVALRVRSVRREHGPATIVEPIQHPDMDRAARALASQLGLSGPFGLDFILTPDESHAVLLELNPRATPTVHLHLDLPQMACPLFHTLANCLGSTPPPPGPPLAAGRIALFPQAIEPNGSVPDDARLDLPGAEEVVRLCYSARFGLPRKVEPAAAEAAAKAAAATAA